MKILLGVPEYPPYHVGGGGEVFKQLAENYKKLGHDVVVIYGYYKSESWSDDIKEYTDENGIKFYQIPEIPYPKAMPFLRTVMPANFKAWRQLKKIIKKENPDIAHLHGYGLFFVNQLARVLKKIQIEYMLTLHGAPVSPDKMGGVIGFVYYFYKLFLGTSLLKNAHEITAVSKYTRTFKEFKKFKNKIIVINNGIDIDEFASFKSTRNTYSDFISADENDVVIFLSLGRLEWLKGFQFFIKVLPHLIKKGYNPKYFIAGTDNGLKDDLQKIIIDLHLENNVFFLGQLNQEDKKNALYHCNMVIVPSLIENFPAVPLEAMAMGKIPIVNNVGGMPEIVIDKKNGLVISAENQKEFSKNVNILMKDSVLQEKIKNDLAQVKKYNWKEITKTYINNF